MKITSLPALLFLKNSANVRPQTGSERREVKITFTQNMTQSSFPNVCCKSTMAKTRIEFDK